MPVNLEQQKQADGQGLPVMSGRADYPESTIPETSSLLPGVNVLLIGEGGTGKTHSIGTLVETGVEVFFLGLEAGHEALLGYFTDRGRPIPDNLHWHVLQTTGGGFSDLAAEAKQIGDLVQDQLYKLQDFERSKNNRFHSTLVALSNFRDDRTGQSFGDVGKWGPNRALVMDGLTGLGKFAWSMIVGKKPVKSQTDYQIAQTEIEKLLRTLCDSCKCHFVLLAHVEREVDQIQGGAKISVSTLGRALPPQLPPLFSDVILAKRTANKWTWDTADSQATLKTRNLEVKGDQLPDFRRIIDKWTSRGGRFSPTVKV